MFSAIRLLNTTHESPTGFEHVALDCADTLATIDRAGDDLSWANSSFSCVFPVHFASFWPGFGLTAAAEQ